MKVYKFWCEFEFDGNCASNSGVYLDKDAFIKYFNSINAESWEELEEQGLAECEVIDLSVIP